LSHMPTKLGDVANIFVGLQTSADTVFLFKDVPSLKGTCALVYSKELRETLPIETALLKPVVRSGSIGRYFARATAAVLFPYSITGGKPVLIPEDVMRREFPNAWKYLLRNKALLSEREHRKFKASGWYQLYPKNLDLWEQPKILVPYMVRRLSAFFDAGHNYFVNVTTGGFGVTLPTQHGDIRYFTGLLNSRLLDWMVKKVSTTFHGGYFAANKQFLVQLPLRTVNLDDREDKAAHDKMLGFVESMLTLHRRLAAAKSAAQKDVMQRQIDATDAEIDRLVYHLYGLTREEIALVEEETA